MQQEVRMIPEHAIKVHVKYVRQKKDYTCGVSALQAVFHYYGLKVTEHHLERIAKSDPTNGTSTENLIKVARAFGFKNKAKHNMDIRELKEWLDMKRPVIVVLQQKGSEKDYKNLLNGHYMVAIGYDERNLYFEDPATDEKRGKIEIKEFLKRWKDADNDDMKYRWGLAVWRDNKHPVYPQKINEAKNI